MCMCRPLRSAHGARVSRSIASGACARLKPNFEPAWPVRIAAWVSATTPGRDPDHHLDRGLQRLQLVELVEVVDDDPRARLRGGLELGRDFALPWKTIRSPVKPAFAPARAPRRRRRRRSGPPRGRPSGRRCREGLGGEHDSSPSPIAPVNSRARPRRSSSATTYTACRTRRRARPRHNRRCAGGRHRSRSPPDRARRGMLRRRRVARGRFTAPRLKTPATRRRRA